LISLRDHPAVAPKMHYNRPMAFMDYKFQPQTSGEGAYSPPQISPF